MIKLVFDTKWILKKNNRIPDVYLQPFSRNQMMNDILKKNEQKERQEKGGKSSKIVCVCVWEKPVDSMNWCFNLF